MNASMQYANLSEEQLFFLKQLLDTHSPSGNEFQLVQLLQKHISPYCQTITDSIGNLYLRTGENAGMKVMITAHSDEVGFQVVFIDKNGLVYVRSIAGVDSQTIPGSPVIAITKEKDVFGVIGKKPPHILESKEAELTPHIYELWVDFGFTSDKEASNYLKCGDYITFHSNSQFTANGRRVISKAIDNKISVFVLAEVIKAVTKRHLPLDVIGVATAQEELGYRGAVVATNRVRPDVAFCLDVGIATDIPNISNQRFGSFLMGAGVGIDINANCNEVLVDSLIHVANNNQIAYQRTVGYKPNGSTEACVIQLANIGVPTANLSIPCRYLHSLVEMCDLFDVAAAIRLLENALEKLCYMKKTDFFLFGVKD